MKKSAGKSTYQRQLKGSRDLTSRRDAFRLNTGSKFRDRLQQRLEGDEIDLKFGFDRMKEGPTKLGWLLNFLAVTFSDDQGTECSGLDLYFLDRNGSNFKATLFYKPYFYLDIIDPRRITELAQQLQKRFETCSTEVIEKEDLEMPNHLSGKKHKFLKVSFNVVSDLMDAKSKLAPIIQQNIKREKNKDYTEDDDNFNTGGFVKFSSGDIFENIVEMREYDVPYVMRAAIDLDLRVGSWYEVTPVTGSETCDILWKKEMLELCDLRVLAFDIECEKAPLKFPDASRDRIYMISYMVAGQGYLLINREIVSEDVDDFEYTPLAKLPGPFIVINEPNEERMLLKFISHIQELRPHVIVTYNGDYFDWPFVENRCNAVTSLNLYQELGIRVTTGANKLGNMEIEYVGRCLVHLDAFAWVKRDSYLPQGNQGLKAVTRYKLGYDPVEVDPEDMLRLARERPTHMASYSVSDAVATYYLYSIYVHNFIFSLSTIIPMGPEDVLRKGSGTLCEALLMVEAYKGNIICPNKQNDPLESFHNGHLLESETYIGGHVECLEAGVFRADIPAKFKLVPSALQSLIDRIDRDLTFALETENDIQRTDVTNYDEVRQAIVEKLEMLRDRPLREEPPVIYHLDVGAMYPNIILTNRLQPAAMVSQKDCAACEFNRAENDCKRPMTWTWRGEFSPSDQSEYNSVRRQLTYEKIGDQRFVEMSDKEQAIVLKDRLKKYSNRVYKKTKQTLVEDRVNTICMRENAFYVNTVRAFRDRRYEYKLLTKTWKGKKIDAEKVGDALARKAAEDKEVLMDSLQLAHKCILNSFYGYVMRKGARWRSMEMAGIVTYTGAELIKQARELVEQVGRPLELDTDGIWCILPSTFPCDFKFKTKSGRSVSVGYPCAMLNADVHDRYTNLQYQDVVPGTGGKKYTSHSECSIYFELDGPYRAMVLPASPEEGKLLKKKYVVFNFDGTIAELKGFEIKRRGELELVKIFQSQVFEQFLAGKSLNDCYTSVGQVANQWLDILDTQGRALEDSELMELISERKTISKTLDDYDGRKATSLTTASRLADFLGAEMVKDKGLNCNLIISRLPEGTPVTERAIPVAIFSAEPAVKKYYLRKWLKDPSLDCSDFRDVVDWSYYKERLGKTVQKIVTIPAGMQGIANPVPRVEHPIWLNRILAEISTGLKQMKISSMFAVLKGPSSSGLVGPRLVADSALSSPSTTITSTPTKKKVSLQLSPGKASTIAERKRTLGSEGHQKDGLAVAAMDMEDMLGHDGRGTGGRPVAHYRTKKSVTFDLAPLTPIPTIETIVEVVSDTEEEPSKRTPLDSASMQTKLQYTSNYSNEGTAEISSMTIDDVVTENGMQLWLETRKNVWKEHKKKRREDSRRWSSFQVVPGTENSAPKRPVAVSDFVRNAALAAAHGVWQIIEVQETDIPGEFVVWAMIGASQLQRLKVTVPRVILVNCRGSEAENAVIGLGGVQVKRDLPHSRTMHKLYEVHVSERKFQRNEKILASFFCDPQIEGVYETLTPLWFRTIMKLGCLAQVKNIRDARGTNTFKLQDIDMVNASAHPYLQHTQSSNSTGVFKTIFIYFAADKSRNSGFGGLGMFIIDGHFNENFLLDNSNNLMSGKAFLWLACGRSFESKPPLQRLYRKFQPDERGVLKFSTKFTSTIQESFQSCSEALSQYLRQRHGPTVVIAQGSFDSRAWRRHIPVLQEFPLASVPSNSSDDMFPAIGWQTFLGERMIQRFLIFPRWMIDRLSCARYANIPMCNLGVDAPTMITDVIFGRQLQHNRHLLWASDGGQPDLGGAEIDDHSLWSDPLTEPIVNCPGAHRTICVELDVFGMEICSIMCSGQLDVENLNTVSAGNKVSDSNEHDVLSSSSIATDGSSARAFNLLKSIVAKWYDDMTVRGDAISHSLLTTLYRYLSGYGDGLLKDPSIHRIVYNLMTKLFKRLIGQLRRLGTLIVYANFNRIILNTKKYDLAGAQEYVDFIVSALRTNDTFAYLEINTKEFWQQLLWLGPENWGGLIFPELNDTEASLLENLPSASSNSTYNDVADEEVLSNYDKRSSDVSGQNKSDSSSTSLKKINSPSKSMDEYDFLDHLLDDKSSKKSNQTKSSKVIKSNNKGVDFEEDEDDEIENDEDLEYEKGVGIVDEDGNFIPEESQENDGADDEMVEAGSDPLLRSSWNLASYLPPAAAIYFKHIVGEYMLQFKKYHEARTHRRDMLLSSQSRSEDAQNRLDDESIEEAVIEDMKSMVQKQLAIGLLRLVDELSTVYSHTHTYSSATSFNRTNKENYFSSPNSVTVFPSQAGSHLHPTSPALEFVKATTHVLALDVTLEEEVSSLKRVLLAQLRVREFSEESQFRDPCLSYVLNDVICSFCSSCRDYDLLRDPVLSDGSLSVSERWRCSNCGTGINLVQIEDRLIGEVSKLCTAYLLQDFRCPKTRAVSARLCCATSDLSVELVMDLPPKSIKQTLEIVLRVAQFHKFNWLEQSTLELLS